MDERYFRRGVSADKDDVHQAVKYLDKGIFKNAFCKVLPDIASSDAHYCNIMHSDTAGTKTSLAYLYWKETGDMSVWKNIVQDALIMNIDDLICVGAVGDIIVSSYIGRNRHLINSNIITHLIRGSAECINELNNLGIGVTLAGGETADVGDIVRTLDIGFCAFARLAKKQAIEINIQSGDVIVGLSSSGQASYESEYNSGIGCNGLTSARHDVLAKYLFARYPESYDPAVPQDLVYSGSMKLTDIDNATKLHIGKLLLSPTRTFSPVIKKVLNKIPISELHGMVHCSGGGQTKVMHFMPENLCIIKDNLFNIPPVFEIIQQESGTSYREMYKVFNMGHRMEIYIKEDYAQEVINIAGEFNIAAQIIGYCESSTSRKLKIINEFGEFIYQ